MVRLVDLEKDGIDEDVHLSHHTVTGSALRLTDDDRPNPNASLPFSIALACYPIISQLAGYIDLTTLHELSSTCRQFRATLLQIRKLLIEQALRCDNEKANPAYRLGNALNASFEQWTAYGRNGVKIGRISSGKLSACARDMVGECRRCGSIVCRNCVAKAPQPSVLKGRHRRLCRACMKSSLDKLLVVDQAIVSISNDDEEVRHQTLARSPCTCNDGVWICQPCGQSVRSMDTTYLRGWVWRNRYSACGGIGAGLGEGNEGVECGRQGACLNASEVEKEIECDASELATLSSDMEKVELEGRQWAGSSYTTHETIGIGGVVKKKLKKTTLVGAPVKEYEDERLTDSFLRREQEGINRSWCSWCARVALGKKDAGLMGRSAESVASEES